MELRVATVGTLGLVALLLGACTGGGSEASPTTTVEPLLTTTTTSGSPETTTTSTTLAPLEGASFPQYQIVFRTESEALGDTVVVLLDPDSYENLTDLDLYDVIADVAEEFPPVYEVHVVDSAEAAVAVLLEEPTEEQRRALADHYLVRLEEGFRIVYVGPFDSSASTVLGS